MSVLTIIYTWWDLRLIAKVSFQWTCILSFDQCVDRASETLTTYRTFWNSCSGSLLFPLLLWHFQGWNPGPPPGKVHSLPLSQTLSLCILFLLRFTTVCGPTAVFWELVRRKLSFLPLKGQLTSSVGCCGMPPWSRQTYLLNSLAVPGSS